MIVKYLIPDRVALVKRDRGEWAGSNERWWIGIHFGACGLGIVRMAWGWRILLLRWQIVVFDMEDGET